MATTVARLQAVLGADTRGFDRAMDKSQGRMHKAGKVAGVLGGVLAGGLVLGLKSSAQEAIEAEKVQARLEKAYKAAGLSLNPYKKSIDQVEKSSRKLGFSDEEAKTALGSLIIATGNHKKALQDLNVAQDLARFKGMSLEGATKTLTMAMGGSQRAAKQLGLSVQAVTTEQDKAKKAFDDAKDAINRHYDSLGKLTPAEEKAKQAALDHAKAQYEGAKAAAQVADKQVTAGKVIDLVKDKVKGQASAYAETTEGGIKVFQAQMDEMKEQIGKAILPALQNIVKWLTRIAEFFAEHPKLGQAVLVGLTAALVAATGAQIALNLAVLANPYVAAAVAVIALAGGVYLLYTRVKELRPYIEFVVETIAGIPLTWRLALLALGGVSKTFDRISSAVEKLVGWLKDAVKYVKDLAGWIGKIHAPKLDLNPFGDPANPNLDLGGMGTGPKSVSSSLYDELGGARMFGLTMTSGYRPGARTKHGTKSDHSYYPSKAIDVAGSPSQMARFFRWLIGQTDVKQAFYDPLGSIFGGALSSYREGGHSDHVHVATYDKGGFLQPGWNLAYNGLGRPEPVGAMGDINLYVDGQRLFTWFQNAERKNKRRGGR